MNNSSEAVLTSSAEKTSTAQSTTSLVGETAVSTTATLGAEESIRPVLKSSVSNVTLTPEASGNQTSDFFTKIGMSRMDVALGGSVVGLVVCALFIVFAWKLHKKRVMRRGDRATIDAMRRHHPLNRHDNYSTSQTLSSHSKISGMAPAGASLMYHPSIHKGGYVPDKTSMSNSSLDSNGLDIARPQVTSFDSNYSPHQAYPMYETSAPIIAQRMQRTPGDAISGIPGHRHRQAVRNGSLSSLPSLEFPLYPQGVYESRQQGPSK